MDELQKRLEGYLDAIEASAGTAGEFVAEQTPLVAQEYLAWVFWEATVLAMLFALAAIVCFAVSPVVYRNARKADFDEAVTIPLFLGCLGVLAAAYHAVIALKVCVAPRLVLLEKIAELIP